MVINKDQPPAKYSLVDVTESELKTIVLSLIEFQKPFGVKNGYQDLARQVYTKIINSAPEVTLTSNYNNCAQCGIPAELHYCEVLADGSPNKKSVEDYYRTVPVQTKVVGCKKFQYF